MQADSRSHGSFKQCRSHDGRLISTTKLLKLLKLLYGFAIQIYQLGKQVSYSLSGVTERLKLGGILLRSSSLT